MTKTRRRKSLLVLVVSMVLLAGCGGGTGGGTPTAEATATAMTYQEDASEYLLDASEFGDGWEATDSYETELSPDGLLSGNVLELSSDEGNVTLTLLVFDSPPAATTHMQNKRDQYTQDGLQIGNVDEGDGAFRTQTFGGETIYAVRQSNVYVHVTGDVEVSTARRLASDQLDAIVSS